MFTESRKSTSWINAEMKTSMLVLLVVAVHGALVGSLLFVGGCGRKTTAPAAPVVAPEATVPMPMPQTVAEQDVNNVFRFQGDHPLALGRRPLRVSGVRDSDSQ